MTKIATSASQIFAHLKGLLCLHKPGGMSVGAILETLNRNVIKDLNEANPDYLQRLRKNQKIQENGGLIDYSSHPLVLGDVYEDQDIEFQLVNSVSDFTSGLLLVTVNDIITNEMLHDAMLPKQYVLDLTLGKATDNSFCHGKVLERSTFAHLKNRPQILEKAMAQICSAHQRDAFKQAGVNLQSQEAYDMAVKGLVRPVKEQAGCAIIYRMECVHFQPPKVKLKVTCINESPIYLAELSAELGLKLRTNAVLDRLQLVSYGPFATQDSILSKSMSLQQVLNNISDNHSKLLVLKQMVNQQNPTLTQI